MQSCQWTKQDEATSTGNADTVGRVVTGGGVGTGEILGGDVCPRGRMVISAQLKNSVVGRQLAMRFIHCKEQKVIKETKAMRHKILVTLMCHVRVALTVLLVGMSTYSNEKEGWQQIAE